MNGGKTVLEFHVGRFLIFRQLQRMAILQNLSARKDKGGHETATVFSEINWDRVEFRRAKDGVIFESSTWSELKRRGVSGCSGCWETSTTTTKERRHDARA
jgi:hypothetical protein